VLRKSASLGRPMYCDDCRTWLGFGRTLCNTCTKKRLVKAATSASSIWPPQHPIRCSNCGGSMLYLFDIDALKCFCGNFVTRQFWMASQDPTMTTRCTQCGKPSVDVVCPSCVQNFKVAYAVGANIWTQTTQYCSYCSAGLVKVAMTEHPNFYICSCGHAEYKDGSVCPCHKCVTRRSQRQSTWTAAQAAHAVGHAFTWRKSGFNKGTGYKPMTPTGNIRIWWDTSVSAYRLVSPFNIDLVNALKTQIPVSDRSYDATTKVWTFVERQLTPLQALLKMLNLQAVVITRAQAEAAAQQSQTGNAGARSVKPLDTVICEFVRLLPLDAAKTAYRKAAMELHPDKQSGDASKMQALNLAWQRIEKEVYNA
jgi:hypothetical protein